jgi:hypothetical protein
VQQRQGLSNSYSSEMLKTPNKNSTVIITSYRRSTCKDGVTVHIGSILYTFAIGFNGVKTKSNGTRRKNATESELSYRTGHQSIPLSLYHDDLPRIRSASVCESDALPKIWWRDALLPYYIFPSPPLRVLLLRCIPLRFPSSTLRPPRPWPALLVAALDCSDPIDAPLALP